MKESGDSKGAVAGISRWGKALPLACALSLVALSLPVLWKAEQWFKQRMCDDQFASVCGELCTRESAVLTSVKRRYELLNGLEAFVKAELRSTGRVNEQKFQSFARDLVQGLPGVREVAVAPEGAAALVFRKPGLAVPARERHLLDDPSLKGDIKKAIAAGQVTISRPFELPDGQLGVGMLKAVRRGGRFWGLLSMELSLAPVWTEAGFEHHDSSLELTVRAADGLVPFGNESIFLKNPARRSIRLGHNTLELAAVPKYGWGEKDRETIRLFRVGTILIVGLFACLAYILVNRQQRLGVAVTAKTRLLSATNEALEREIEERRQAEEALRQAHDQLEDRVRERTAELDASNERLRQEMAARQVVAEALRESEERYQLAVRGAGEGLWDWSRENQQIYVSPEGRALLGLPEAESHFALEPRTGRVHPDDVERVKALVKDAIAGQTPHFRAEFRLEGGDGQWRWILARGIALRDRSGELIRMAGTLSDTTEQRHEFQQEVLDPLQQLAEKDTSSKPGNSLGVSSPEEELRAIGAYLRRFMSEVQDVRTSLARSQSELRTAEQLASVGRLAAGIAHEIRNPLTALKVRLFSLQTAVGEDPASEDDFRVISQEIERLENIVNDFLDFSRPREVHLEACDVSRLVHETLTLLDDLFRSRGIRVSAAIDSELGSVPMDPAQLKQMLINLLKNAADAVEEGGRIEVSAGASVRPSGRRVLLVRVSDDGCGITAEVQSRLFEPFFTTKVDGTGLGLSVSAKILKGHGGRLFLEETSDRGTTFAIEVPAPRQGPDAHSASPSEPAHALTS